MERCHEHNSHDHVHNSDCGHTSIAHDGHTDYLHDGHMHHVHADHVDEHIITVNKANPSLCTPDHRCKAHDERHVHGHNCGHEQAPHGDHFDYIVGGHLHHAHGG